MLGAKVLTDNVVTNLQAQIDTNKARLDNLTSEDVGIPQTIAQIFGLPENASVSEVLMSLHTTDQSIIDALTNASKFLQTQDFKTAGTYTFSARGDKGLAVIIGGGGGGVGGPSYGTGGAGGGYGALEISSIINLSKGQSYNVVVGSGGTERNNGGSSSCFSKTAAGGSYGSGGSGGSGGNNSTGGTGKNGASSTKEFSVGSFTVRSGGGGGGGGAISDMTTGTHYGGSGGNGAGNGGSGGYGKRVRSGSSYKLTCSDGSRGGDATEYGGGGGGGGAGGLAGNIYDEAEWGSGGSGGSGKCGRVIVYESGIYDFG